MTKIVKIVILILLLVLPSISFAADIYRWVDKDGSVNFTDDLDKVPPEYRDQVRTEEVRDSEQTQTSTPAPASGQKTVTPVSASPWIIAQLIALAPRWRGSNEG